MESGVKAALSMILANIDARPPQTMDTIDYALGLLVKGTFDALEAQPVALTLEEVPDNEKPDETAPSESKEG